MSLQVGHRVLLWNHEGERRLDAKKRMMVIGKVHGHESKMLLDIGADANFTYWAQVRKLGLPVTDQRLMVKGVTDRSTTVRTVDGQGGSGSTG